MGWLRLLLVVGIVAAAAGCTATVRGTAVVPPGTDPSADVRLTDDGYGIELGKIAAPTALEIFIEPQCPHCANFEMEFGDQLADYIGAGDLAVTYRPLTFLDRSPGGTSAKVSNALFLAADAGISAVELQDFLRNLYTVQSAFAHYGEAMIAQVALDSHLPQDLIERIEDGDTAVDATAMDAANTERFRDLFDEKPYTPGVYDLDTSQSVTVDDDWLTDLVG